MITSRKPPRVRAVLAFSILLSIAIHLFGGALWERFHHVLATLMLTKQQQLVEQPVATSDVIRIERRSVPRVSRHRPRTPQPVVPRVQRAPVAPVLPQPEILRPSPVAQKPRPQPSAQPEVARTVAHAAKEPAPPSARKAQLSEQQLAQLNAQFSKTIADARTDLTTIAKQQAPASTVRRYSMQFEGIHADLRRGDGTIEPISRERRGNTTWYYCRYTYMYPDGRVEQDDIPWPFHYAVNADPFARGVRRIPLQAPPAGYVPNRPLKPILQQFFGGPPVG